MKQNHAVSQRFIACVAQLKSQKNIRSYRQFACELDFLPQSLSEIIQQRRDVTIDLLQKAIHFYNFNPIFLFTGQGDFFVDKADNNLPTALYEQIIYVPATAQGAYAQQYPSKKLLKELATFALPEFKYKTTLHRAFEITGDSMETGLFEGDKVVANFIPSEFWVDTIKNNYVYVIVSRHEIIVQRVHNQLVERQQLWIIPDNSYYPPYAIALETIREIWYVRVKISPFLPSPQRLQRNLSEDMLQLQQTLTAQTLIIQNLTQTVENLHSK